jgi:hypothetical protein
MPVILVGALGGMATDGIIGMFVGATLLALAWQVVTGWVDEIPDANIPPAADEPRLVTQAQIGPSDVRRTDQKMGFARATRWSRSERSSICGMSGKDRQAWRVRRAVP